MEITHIPAFVLGRDGVQITGRLLEFRKLCSHFVVEASEGRDPSVKIMTKLTKYPPIRDVPILNSLFELVKDSVFAHHDAKAETNGVHKNQPKYHQSEAGEPAVESGPVNRGKKDFSTFLHRKTMSACKELFWELKNTCQEHLAACHTLQDAIEVYQDLNRKRTKTHADLQASKKEFYDLAFAKEGRIKLGGTSLEAHVKCLQSNKLHETYIEKSNQAFKKLAHLFEYEKKIREEKMDKQADELRSMIEPEIRDILTEGIENLLKIATAFSFPEYNYADMAIARPSYSRPYFYDMDKDERRLCAYSSSACLLEEDMDGKRREELYVWVSECLNGELVSSQLKLKKGRENSHFNKMDEFLKTSKAKLNDDGGKARVHVVIGNEACDLDSTVSAIIYAYFLYTKNKDEDSIIAPVINVAENQFRLRTETTHFFRKLNIQAKNLIFRDQVDFWRLQQDDRLELTLVDHNVLTGTDTQFEDCVVEVIDHHVQERPPDDRVKVKLDFVGSCSTLVAEELLDDTDCILDEVCAELLYGTILVDTINRSPDAGKITPRDEAVLNKLESIIPYVKGDKLFEELQAAKFDISDLLNMEILEKDLKMVTGPAMTIAMCSVTMDMKELLERPDFKEDLDEFCEKQKCEVVVIMTLVNDEAGKPTRQIAVYSQNRIFRDQVADTLDNSEEEDLELELEFAPFDDITVFKQGNVKASRKKVMPILKSFLHGDLTPDVSSKDFVTQHSVPAATEGFSHLEVGVSENDTEENESRVKFTIESMEGPSIEEDESESERDVESYRNFETVQLDSPGNVDTSHTVHVQQTPTRDYDILITAGKTGTPKDTDKNTQNPYRDLASSSGLLSSAHSSNLFDLGISDSELVDPFSSVEESAKPDSSENSPKEKKLSQSSESKIKTDEKPDVKLEEINGNFSDTRNPFVADSAAENQIETGAQNVNPFIPGDTEGANDVVNFQLNDFDDDNSLTESFEQDDLTNMNFNNSSKYNFLNVNSLGVDHPPARKSASLIVECDAKSQADDLADLEESELFDKMTTPELGQSGENSPFGLPGGNSPFINSYTGTPYHSRTASDSGAGLPDFVVPPNSRMDQEYFDTYTDRRLPSFNNAEMVERIHQKKASLEACEDLLDLEQTEGETSTPYTPQNSFRDSGMFVHEVRDNSLPNLLDVEILEKVQQKRDSLSANLKSSDSNEGAEVETSATNPFGDFSDFTSTAVEAGLSSSNPFFQTSKESLDFDPFAPINPFNDNSDQVVPSNSLDKGFIGSLTGFEPQNEENSNEDIFNIFGNSDDRSAGLQSENQTGSVDLLNFGTDYNSQSDSNSGHGLNPFLTNFENNDVIEPSSASDQMDQFSTETKDDQSCVNLGNVDQSTMKALNESANLEAADVVSEVLAKEIIHDALESFPDIANPLFASEMIQRNDVDWTDQGSGDSGIGSTGSPQQGPKVQVRRLTSDYSVETEYLPSMDPLHGSLNIMSNSSRTRSIETDADKEVVEGESFRKVSGEVGLPVVPETLGTHNRTSVLKAIPEKIRDMIIAENIQSAIVSSDFQAEEGNERNFPDNESLGFVTETSTSLKEGESESMFEISEKTDFKDDIKDTNKENEVGLSVFDDEVFETNSKYSGFVDPSSDLTAVIEHVKDGILQENIHSSAVDMNLSNSNNNFVGEQSVPFEGIKIESLKLDSEGNVINNTSDENLRKQETDTSEIQTNQLLFDINDFENLTNKDDNNENSTHEPNLGMDILSIGREDRKESEKEQTEEIINQDLLQRLESKFSESLDSNIHKEPEHNLADMQIENDNEATGSNIEGYEDTEYMLDTSEEVGLANISSGYEDAHTDSQSFEDDRDIGIDNKGFQFDLSEANIEKDSERVTEEEIYDKEKDTEQEITVSACVESTKVPEKTTANWNGSESDNSVSSDSSSSFASTSESESELITVRENTNEQLQPVIYDSDLIDGETAESIRGSSTVKSNLQEEVNTGPDFIDKEEVNVITTDCEDKEPETEHVNIEEPKKETELIDIKETDIEYKPDIKNETIHTQNVTDKVTVVSESMTESSLTVESVSPVETPLGEYASGFYEVNPEKSSEHNFDDSLTSSAFETNLGENETGFYEVNQDEDVLVQSAVTIESVSSVESPDQEKVTGYYEVNAELLELAIEKDNTNFLKIDEDYSDASVSPLETPDTENVKGFYDINADNLEKAIERIDSLDLNNSLTVESTYSDDSSISPMETPELENYSGFYEINANSRVLGDNNAASVESTAKVMPLGPSNAPEINIELVESVGSSKDSFDSETEPSFELNDSKSMEEERKVNEVDEEVKNSEEGQSYCENGAYSVTEISDTTEKNTFDDQNKNVKEHETEYYTNKDLGDFDSTPDIKVEMTSSTDSLDSNDSAEAGFYEMNAEIQGTVLQNIEIGSAFSPIESPSEEVFKMDYEINPMVPDLHQDSVQSSEEDYAENRGKPFVRFCINEIEIDDKVEEMAGTLVETALVEAIGSLQEQYTKNYVIEKEIKQTNNTSSVDEHNANEKYLKLADGLVNEAITSAIELVQEIRLSEEEPFITSEIASAMRESLDSSDSEVSSTTTEGSYRIVNSVDFSPAATPDRDEVSSPDLIEDRSEVTLDEAFERQDFNTEDKIERFFKEDLEMENITTDEKANEIVFDMIKNVGEQDEPIVNNQYINDENGNITDEQNLIDDLVPNKTLMNEVEYEVPNGKEEVVEHDNKLKALQRQETLIPDIVISTEETPPSSDENDYDQEKEALNNVFSEDMTEVETESKTSDSAVLIEETKLKEKEHKNEFKEIETANEVTAATETEFFVGKKEVEHHDDSQGEEDLIETEGVCGGSKAEIIDLTDEIVIEALIETEDVSGDSKAEILNLKNEVGVEDLIKTEDMCGSSKAEVIDLTDDINTDVLVEKQDFVKNELDENQLTEESLTIVAKESPVPDIVSFDELIEKQETDKLLQSNKDDKNSLKSISENINAETSNEEDRNKTGVHKKGETPYHNIKDLESEKDEKKSARPKKGHLEYITRKEIFYTSAGTMSISIDSVVDAPSDTEGYTGSQDIIHEESNEPVDDEDDTSEKHVVIEKVEPEKPKPSHEKMKMDDTQEWHEDPIPGMGAATQDSSTDESDTESDSEYTKPPRPDSLLNGTRRKKKISANNFLSPDSTDDLIEGVDDIPTPDDLETPSDIEGEGLEWEDDTPITPTSDTKKFAEYRDDDAEREKYENTKFRKVEIAGKDYRVDMKVIEPYKKVLSHGGYYGDGLNAIILFCGCYLPDRGRHDYQYVMDNLFLYVISTLELLVAEDYMIVYFHGATPRRQMPSFGWLKRCYQMIDRRLRKNLKALLMVHPTLWLKTVVLMTKPFISSKFSSKLRFVKTLQELGKIVPMEYIYVPEPVSQYDAKLTVQHRPCTSAPASPSSPS